MPSTFPLILWCLVLVAVLVVLALVVNSLRKYYLTPSPPAGGPAFTLGDMRKMRDSGQISAEEFEKAKARIVAATQAALARAKPPSPESAPTAANAEFDTIVEIARRRKLAQQQTQPPPLPPSDSPPEPPELPELEI